MKLKNRIQFWKLQNRLTASADFKSSLKKNLDQAWHRRYGLIPWYQTRFLHRAGAFAVVIIVLASGGGAFAYSSPEVTEGNPLYPIKKALERVEEATKLTPQAKAQFYLKKIERREAEKMVLEKKGNYLKIANDTKDEEGFESEDSSATSTDGSNVSSKEDYSDAERNELKARMIKAERSIEEAEDRLEKFSEDIKKIEIKSELKPELREKIEKRLEERKKKIENISQKIEERRQKIEDSKNKFIENKESVKERLENIRRENEDRRSEERE